MVKRSIINKYSVPMFPVFENDGTKKYMIAYDPASKLDNSVICVAELFRDEEKGLMLKLVNCKNLIEKIGNEKAIIQKPEQIEILKNIILDYNKGSVDYENLDMVIIDAGSGGGGSDIAAFLMSEWKGKDKKTHIGFIDPDDPYMQLRADDYPGNSNKLQMFNFKRDKTIAYERTRRAINEGLVVFPASVNARGEIEFEEIDSNGDVVIKYEKVDNKDFEALIQFDLCKEELVSMQSIKSPNGNIKFDLSTEAKQKNMHDDHADVIAMLCNRLMELRANEALEIDEKPKDDLSKIFVKKTNKINKNKNPFIQKQNPFTFGKNPFVNK